MIENRKFVGDKHHLRQEYLKNHDVLLKGRSSVFTFQLIQFSF